MTPDPFRDALREVQGMFQEVTYEDHQDGDRLPIIRRAPESVLACEIRGLVALVVETVPPGRGRSMLLRHLQDLWACASLPEVAALVGQQDWGAPVGDTLPPVYDEFVNVGRV